MVNELFFHMIMITKIIYYESALLFAIDINADIMEDRLRHLIRELREILMA